MQLKVSTGAEKPDQKWIAILDLAIESCACVDPTVCAFYITDKLHVELPNPTQNPVRAAASHRFGLHALATPPIGAVLPGR